MNFNQVSSFKGVLIHICMKIVICILCILGVGSCDFFRSRPNIGELVRSLDTDSTLDMHLSDSLTIHVHINNISFEQGIDNHIVDYIPLETNEQALIGKIDQLIVHDDKIFILDRDISKSIFIFRSDGFFINKISKYGQNEDEYKLLRNIELDTINHQLIAYDRNGGKLLFYDLEGNFIRTQKLGIRFLEFKLLPNGKYLFYTSNSPNNFNPYIANFGLLIGTPEGKINYRALKNNKFLEELNYQGKYNCYGANGKMYVCPRLSNAIYEVGANGVLNIIYQIYLPLGSMEEYIQVGPLNFDKEISTKGYYYSLGDGFLINDSLFCFRFVDPNRVIFTLWYNRNNGQHCIHQSYSSIFSSIRNLYLDNNQCIGVVEGDQILQHKLLLTKKQKKTYYGVDKISEQTLRKIETITENDNPLLIVYRIKWKK